MQEMLRKVNDGPISVVATDMTPVLATPAAFAAGVVAGAKACGALVGAAAAGAAVCAAANGGD
jgi:hypothetical protein